MVSQEVRAKFVASIEEETNGSECWKWIGKDKKLFIYEPGTKKKYHARDIGFLILHGELPKVAFRMKCGNALCVNPAHFVNRERRRGRPSLDLKTRKERKAERQRVWRAKLKAQREELKASQAQEKPVEASE